MNTPRTVGAPPLFQNTTKITDRTGINTFSGIRGRGEGQKTTHAENNVLTGLQTLRRYSEISHIAKRSAPNATRLRHVRQKTEENGPPHSLTGELEEIAAENASHDLESTTVYRSEQ